MKTNVLNVINEKQYHGHTSDDIKNFKIVIK